MTNTRDPEHIRRFNDTYGRPSNEGDPFHEWFRGACLYFQRKYDPDVENAYRSVLGSIPVTQLQTVWLDILGDENLRHMPRAGEIRGKCRQKQAVARSHYQQSAPAERDPRKRILYPLINQALVGTSMGVAEPPSDIPSEYLDIAAYVQQQHRENGMSIADCYATATKMLGGDS